jgi:CRISPR-associated endonuclease/helicase Cas3
VIEPSSVQSIVQTVGRVNRHRLDDVSQPNVAVLQFNFNYANPPLNRGLFSQPGLESSGKPYPSHDLQELLDWRELEHCGQIDARMRFNKDAHKFAAYDDAATQSQIKDHSFRFLKSEKPFWMGRDTYEKVPLRDPSKKLTISQDEEGQYHQEHSDGPKQTIWLKTQVNDMPKLSNDWLAYSFDEALAEAQRLKLSSLEAFAVEMLDRDDDQQSPPSHSDSLGYFST